MTSQDQHLQAGAAAAPRSGSPPASLSNQILMMIAFVITAAIVYHQVELRMGVYEAEGLSIFFRLFAFEDYIAAWIFLGVILLALIPKVQQAGLALADRIGANLGWTAILTIAGLALGAKFAYLAHPLSMDEYAPYFQSQVFASGHLVARVSPDLLDWVVPASFQNYFLNVSHRTGEIASTYWPGFALLLTPFMALGVPWLANPFIGGATVFALGSLARELTPSTRDVGLVVLFTVASAAVPIDAVSFYSMAAHLLCSVCYALLLLRPTPKRAFLAGVVGSFALVLHNPLPHIAFAIPWFIWIVTRPARWSLLGALIAGYLPLSALLGVGWPLVLQGLKDGVQTSAAASPGASQFIAHWISVLTGTLRVPNAAMLGAKLIGLEKLWLWATPALLVLACLGMWRTRSDAAWRTLTACAIVTPVVYLFVPFEQGHGWGDRYFHSVWFVLPLLAVAALRAKGSDADNARAERYAAGAAVLCLVLLVPLRLYQAHAFISRHLEQLPAVAGVEPQVLLIDATFGYYALDLVQNDPKLEHRPLKLRSRGRKEDNQFMAEHFPDLHAAPHSHNGSVWVLQANH